MTPEEIEQKQKELVKKVQKFFQKKDKTKMEEQLLYAEIREFEELKGKSLYKILTESDAN